MVANMPVTAWKRSKGDLQSETAARLDIKAQSNGRAGDTGRASATKRPIKSAFGSVPVDAVAVPEVQFRQEIEGSDIDALAQSIRDVGLVQPIVVHQTAGSSYTLIAGLRRLHAARRAGIKRLPALIFFKLDRRAAAELSIVENLQRRDLDPIEEARAFGTFVHEMGHTHAEVARLVGRSRSYVSNTLRLLWLPPRVQEKLSSGVVSRGHAIALLTADDPEAAANSVVAGGLSVRQTERKLRARAGDGNPRRRQDAPPLDSAVHGPPEELECLCASLAAELGVDVEGGVEASGAAWARLRGTDAPTLVGILRDVYDAVRSRKLDMIVRGLG